MNKDRFKFRVWDVQNGKYFKDPNPTPPLNSDGTLGFTYNKPNFQKYYIIEQCTGLKDKNGNLIYEGDILLLRNNNFEVGHNGITVFFKCLTDEYIHIDPLDFDYNHSEIIGNIHKQKENQ